jgi:hypothetical protein
MSSATSIEKQAGFGIWHFFVLLSLVAATVAVLLTRQNTPENLILISLTIGAAGVAAGALYRTLAPLAASEQDHGTQPLSDALRADLEREKALVLRSIKELEFDRAMGKVSAQDFDEMAGRLRSRAIGLMKQLDEGTTYRLLIERELQARTAAHQARPASPVCACGTTNDVDARFCKGCGTKLKTSEGTK